MIASENTSTAALAVLLFWGGVFFLLWLWGAIRLVRRLIRQVRQTALAVEEAFERRREHLRGLLRLLHESQEPLDLAATTSLSQAMESAEHSDTNRFAAEQDISRLLEAFFAELSGASWDAEGEWSLREQQIAPLREHYNEAARALIAVRSAFPLRLVARALTSQDPPLFR